MKVTEKKVQQPKQPQDVSQALQVEAPVVIEEVVEEISDFQRGAASTQVALDRSNAALPTTTGNHRASARDVIGQGSGDRFGTGNGLNNTNGHLPSARGRIASSAWDRPEQILGRLTQTPAGGARSNSLYRCGPSNLLAQSIMNGPQATSAFLRNVARDTPDARMSAGEKQELNQIADRVANRTATYEDLSRAQGLLYQAGNNRTDVIATAQQAMRSGRLNAGERREMQGFINKVNSGAGITTQDGARASQLMTKALGQEVTVRGYQDARNPGQSFVGVEVGGRMRHSDRSGFGDDEISGLGRLGGATGRGVDMNNQTMRQLFDGLRPGEAATIRVAGEDGGSQPDHFVTVGKRPDGTGYIYNPDPTKGDFTLFTGNRGPDQPSAFLSQLQRYEDRTVIDGNNQMPTALVHEFQ